MTPNQMVKILDGQLTDCYAEISEKQGRIAELEHALSDLTGVFSADGVLLKGTHLNATLYCARAALKAKP
jgi:hypothetical protein